jgi:hypothetical protein
VRAVVLDLSFVEHGKTGFDASSRGTRRAGSAYRTTKRHHPVKECGASVAG